MREISKAKIGRLSMLRHKKHRIKEGLFLAEGRKCVVDTLPFFSVDTIVVSDQKMLSMLPEGYEDKIVLASQADMKRISTLADTPDVVAVYELPSYNADVPENLSENEFFLALDAVQDPGNLGTIVRTAHWFGIRDIFCSRDTVDIYNAKTVQATMGSIAKVRIHYVDLHSLFLRYSTRKIYGLLLEGKNIFGVTDFKPGFILMGNEGKGIGESLKPLITDPLTIPPVCADNHPDSLNVGIATGITLAQIIK